MPAVRTVLGDVAADLLGATDYHEHLFQVSPLLVGDELDDEELSGREGAALRASGFSAMIDATPTGLGRNPEAIARISGACDLRVIAATGAHRQAHYEPGHWILERSEAELAAAFSADIVAGMPSTDGPDRAPTALAPSAAPVRAGLIKTGIGYWRISTFERRVLAAAGTAHGETGAPVMVHLEHGSAGFEVLEVLRENGVAADAVVLAHVDRNPDPALHADLAAAGAYLGYDGWARTREWPDAILIDCAIRAADAGAESRLLFGGDVARRSRYVAYGGMPGLEYLGRRILPRFERLGAAALVHAATLDNPARLLARF
jgi:phosphotriesterase-related protein